MSMLLRIRHWSLIFGTVLGCGLGLFAVGGASAVFAATPAARWSITSLAEPTNFSTADNPACIAHPVQASCDDYEVDVTNIGGKETTGGTVTITDALPVGVTVRAITLLWSGLNEIPGHSESEDLNGFCSGSPVVCTIKSSFFTSVARTVHPDDTFKLFVSVSVNEPDTAGVLVNRVSVAGGSAGIAEAAATSENTLELAAPMFGFTAFTAGLLGGEGLPDTQAGAHPYELATKAGLNSVMREDPESGVRATTVEDPRDVVVDLPLGLAGSALSAPTCTFAELSAKGSNKQGVSDCPADTVVGHIRTIPADNVAADGPIYNLVPERGVAAEFGFIDAAGGPHVLYASIAPTPAGYVLRTTTREVTQLGLTEFTVNIYGNPTARDGSSGTPVATFTNPSDCTGEPLRTVIHMDSWQHPGPYNPDGTPDLNDPRWVSSTSESPPVSGCEALAGLFSPSMVAAPEATAADSPSGVSVNIALPQHEEVGGLATPPLRDAVVTLPEGLTVNPSSANGLGACSLAQVGMSPSGVPDAAAPECPDASKLGTVELETPALPSEGCKDPAERLTECPEVSEREKTPLRGAIYLARELENPFGSLLALYIVVDDPRTGVIVKIPADVKPNEATGQLTTVVSNSPQFPFSELRTHFFGGDGAPVRTPATCGTFNITSELTPWSAPESGPPVNLSSPFEVVTGPAGTGCAHTPGDEPNAPAFTAGSETPVAGAYSPLVVRLGRDDGSQEFGQVTVTLPPGATGKLAGIPQCSDGQIAQAQSRSHPGEGATEAASPSCPEAAKIGTVTVGAGAGAKPFFVTGNAYLAGPYKGAPFSAVFVTPVIAGPFDLGTVVVRAGLYIDPVTARVTTRSDELPRILDGIPLDIRSIVVSVNRAGFVLNPTSCDPMTVTGEEVSTQGQAAPLSDRFQVGSCQDLGFKPAFSVSTAGRTSKADGASLSVKVAYPAGSVGTEANIGRVDLQLPKQLPARLTTLQKACTEAQFNANPAGCPVASDIGTAKALTPLLDSPLTGPAYLVSHGGAAFPDVEFLLQGEGVQITLDGKTQIKQGITYSHFETVPDQPISTFETVFPEGKYSVLATNLPASAKSSLCGQSLMLPTTLTAHNGAVLSQSTRATVTGCPKVKALTRAQQLAKALKVCKKDRSKQKRAKCVKQARKKYGPQAKKKTKPKAKPKPKK
jgi:hypothetical protein